MHPRAEVRTQQDDAGDQVEDPEHQHGGGVAAALAQRADEVGPCACKSHKSSRHYTQIMKYHRRPPGVLQCTDNRCTHR